MTTANTARSLAAVADDVTMTSDGAACDVTELTESEKDLRQTRNMEEDKLQDSRCSMHTHHRPNQLLVNCDYDEEEEQRRLDELLSQCHEYIYSQGQNCNKHL